ncbi:MULTISPECIES: adenosylcobinamide-phosphate synthase CbiB [Bacillus]|uniref:adenosylcobinamide-phosphate synthase CbiB n=1 Tax=Bacillus TaxID=1386 RepID=UPI0002DC13BE|nr:MULTISPECIES: adenosylcobinamide-phosphate synthase CbiB [Bacillus]
MHIIIYGAAYVLDLLIGDPHRWPHPVKWMGSFISVFVKCARKLCKNEAQLKFAGLLLWVATVGLSYAVTWGVLEIVKMNMILFWVISIYLAYTTLATKCLALEAKKVWYTLEKGTIEQARKQLSMIVGRDTSHLSKEQISKATVETVAENTSDGVIAPMFYLFLGGPALAMAYKAINTLDSMVGYQNEKYRSIGFISAKVDDMANFIPARLSWLFLVGASFFMKLSWRNALKIGWRDRKKHKSPNCAYPEGAVAGALGLQLGGAHYYFGELVEKPTIGDYFREITTKDISITNKLLYVASFIAFLSFTIVDLTIHFLL